MVEDQNGQEMAIRFQTDKVVHIMGSKRTRDVRTMGSKRYPFGTQMKN